MNPFITLSHFNVTPTDQQVLSPVFLARYANLPTSYQDFLNTFSTLTNPSDTTWFNSIRDFNGESSVGNFAWNEFELQALATYVDEPATFQKVQQFWNRHVPIVLSVKCCYAHYSMALSPENYGKIYYGTEPDYEELCWVANSFEEFIQLIITKEISF